MTGLPQSLVGLVENLHQEYVFVSLYKTLIRQSLQELNDSCEDLFRTLWINHALAHSLSKLLSYERISCAEWIESSNRASSVRFLDSAASLPTSFSAERYGCLLSALRASPVLLADIVRWADSKAMDTDWLVKDVFNVVYGQCVFQQDHELVLQFLGGLLEKHVNSCDSVESLFVDAEAGLSNALCVYSALIPEFKLFLVACLRNPLMELLLCNDYLEYDIAKAGKRLQSSTGDSPRFLFNEDLDTSCQMLARITNILFDCISDSMVIFPMSLKYLIGSVKSHAVTRWPGTTAAQLRKPVSNLLFGILLSSPIVGPENWGVIPADVVINSAARYNLCQVVSIIQACGWSHTQLMYKVIKHVDTELFNNIMDNADGEHVSGQGPSPGGVFPIVSGLHRNAYLASLDQLQNMANLVVVMLETLRTNGSSPALCRQLESLNAEGIGQTSPQHHPYTSSPSSSSSISDASHSAAKSTSPFSSSYSLSSTTTEPNVSASKDTKAKKKGTSKQDRRSQSIPQNLNVAPSQHVSSTKLTVAKSTSGGELHTLLHMGTPHGFQLPSEVFVLPLQMQEGAGAMPLWDFNLLSEEEFMSCTSNNLSPEPELQTIIPSDQTSIPPIQAPVPSDQAPVPSDQAPIPSDQAPVPSDQAPTPPEQAPTPSEQAPTPSEPAPTPPDQVNVSPHPKVPVDTPDSVELVLPPPLPPKRNRPPKPKSDGRSSAGSMIMTPSPERVPLTKRRSQSENTWSPSRNSMFPELSVLKKNRDRVLSANTGGSSNSPQGEIAGLSPQEFRRSQYCTQLSYKLRLIFQSTHTQLAASILSSANLGKSEHGGQGKSEHRGLLEQLVALLKSTLAHQGWASEEMSAGLILETLRMVTPLSDALLAEALAHLCDNTMKRATYVAYLVKSHQRFQGTKVQLTAALDLAHRSKSIRESVFINFVVEKFLESEKERVSSFLLSLEDNLVSDEKVAIMEANVKAFSHRMRQCPDLAGWLDTDAVLACLEDHLFTLAYHQVFHPNGGDSDSLRDQIFSEHFCKLSNNLHPSQPSLQIPADYHISCPWVSAQQHLRMLQLYKSPRGKLRCIVQCCKVLISLLQYAKCGAPPGADDMFPVLVYVLIKANPPNLLSTIQYIKNFEETNLKGEDAYWWTQFSVAVEFSKTI